MLNISPKKSIIIVLAALFSIQLSADEKQQTELSVLKQQAQKDVDQYLAQKPEIKEAERMLDWFKLEQRLGPGHADLNTIEFGSLPAIRLINADFIILFIKTHHLYGPRSKVEDIAHAARMPEWKESNQVVIDSLNAYIKNKKSLS